MYMQDTLFVADVKITYDPHPMLLGKDASVDNPPTHTHLLWQTQDLKPPSLWFINLPVFMLLSFSTDMHKKNHVGYVKPLKKRKKERNMFYTKKEDSAKPAECSGICPS